MRATRLGVQHRARGIEGVLRSMLSNSSHLWMWDFESLEAELEKAGFNNVRRATYGDNPDDHFAVVEDEGRWSNKLGMECRC